MTVREAMDIINGELDLLSEFYDNDADSIFFKKIDAAKAVLEKLVQEEEKKPEKYYAVCPNCGCELDYDTFRYDTCYEDKVYFFSSGYCNHCHKDFTWQEIFKLTKIEFDNN